MLFRTTEPSRRPIRGRVSIGTGVAGATVALLLTATVAPAVAASPAADPTAATAPATAAAADPGPAARTGAGWLAREITANGGYLAPSGSPDAGSTAAAVSAIVASGTGKEAVASALAWLKTQVGNLTDAEGRDDASALANLVLAVKAAGGRAESFGGREPVNNLVLRLKKTQRVGGKDDGLYGAQDPTYDGAYRQGLALAALSTVTASNGQVARARNWLGRQQCANGLWTAYRPDTKIPCPAADPATFSGPDTNSTALALQGLAATGDVVWLTQVLTSLADVQSADGGFPYLAAAGQSSDPNSTAVVAQALVAVGPGVIRQFTVDGATPFDALRSFQLGCSDAEADRGAYFYPGSRTANVLATVQAVPAQARQPLPVAPRQLTERTSAYPCPA